MDANIALYLERRSGLCSDWGMKDPRMVLLWDFWRGRIFNLDDPRLILTHRDTAAIMHSLFQYSGVADTHKGHLLAQAYDAMTTAIEQASPCPCLWLDFENWWMQRKAQRNAVNAFVGRELDYSHWDDALWRIDRTFR